MRSIPSFWVQKFLDKIPRSRGPVLDLACGAGRHALLLLGAGYDVWAVDRDANALMPLAQLGVHCVHADLELDNFKWPFEAEQFAGIVVTNYLHRPLLPLLLPSIADQGVLIYETFAIGNEQFGRPRNPDFLLRQNELLTAFVQMPEEGWQHNCLAFEHGYVNQITEAVVQRICVQKMRKL